MKKNGIIAIALTLIMALFAVAPITFNSAYAASSTKLAAVSSVKLSTSKCGKVTVKYKKVKGAKGYEIYSSTKKNGGYKKIATTKKTSYTASAKAGKKVYFKVRAYSSSKKYGKYSKVKSIKVKNHKYGAYAVTKPATCKEEGSKVKTCKYCKKKATAKIAVDKNAHSYGAFIVTTPATCSREGVKTKTCELCGNQATEKIAIDKNAHSYGSFIVTTPATCSKEGVKTKTCELCGNKATAKIDLDLMDGHNYVTVKATCTQDGKRYCTNCNKVVSTTKASGHDFASSKVTKEPTCIAEGVKTFYCSKCSATKTEAVAKTEHSLDNIVITNATCTEPAVKTYSCKYCDYKQVEKIGPSLGHIYGDYSITKQPTCVADGEMTAVCKVCGKVNTKAVDKSKAYHSFLVGELETEPLCTYDGVMKYVCSSCGEESTRDIPQTGIHRYNAVLNEEDGISHTGKCESCDSLADGPCKYAFTSLENGILTITCTVCGSVMEYPYIENAQCNHTGDNVLYLEGSASTCNERGIDGNIVLCFDCSEDGVFVSIGDVLDPTGHSFRDEIISTSPEDGEYRRSVCSVCGFANDEVTSGHSFVKVSEEPATCKGVGIAKYECKTCGISYYEAIAPKGHGTALVEKRITSCSEYGYISYSCPDCEAELCRDYTIDLVPTGQHILSTTKTPEGYEVTSCSNCDYVKVDKTCYIDLTSRTISVPGVAVFGQTSTAKRDVLNLNYDGVSDYEITGSANNLTIVVNATDDCEVKLNDVTIINDIITLEADVTEGDQEAAEEIKTTIGNSIEIKNKSADEDKTPTVSISAKDGTVNTLQVKSSGANAIQSNAKLELKGHGTLNMSTVSTAVDARAKILIRNLTLNIVSAAFDENGDIVAGNRGIDTKYEIKNEAGLILSTEYANIEFGANANVTIKSYDDGIRCKNMEFAKIADGEAGSRVVVESVAGDGLQLEGNGKNKSPLIMNSGYLELKGAENKKNLNNKAKGEFAAPSISDNATLVK